MTVDWESFTDRTVEAAEVRLLGLADARSVLALQKLMVHEVKSQSRVCAAVLICEHPPVLTSGGDSSLLDLPVDPRELTSRSLDVIKVARDGGTFLHQPGQLMAYVVVSLRERSYGENEFRWRLQDAVISTCEEFQVKAERRSGDENALWGRHGIVCEIGLGFQGQVSSFGIALNVSCRVDELRQFGRGSRGDRMSSLNAERVRLSQMAQVRSSLIENLCEQIQYPEYHIHTGHPFLKRTTQAVR